MSPAEVMAWENGVSLGELIGESENFDFFVVSIGDGLLKCTGGDQPWLIRPRRTQNVSVRGNSERRADS